MQNNRATILYHRDCADGMMSAYLLYRLYKSQGLRNQCVFKSVNYKEALPVVDPTDLLWIVDFSFSPEDMVELSKKADRIIMLDHHESAAGMWGGYRDAAFSSQDGFKATLSQPCGCSSEGKLFSRLVKGKSGALITYEYIRDNFKHLKLEFMDNGRLRCLVDRVSDRDLWKFEFADSKIIHSIITSRPYSFGWLDTLAECSHKEFDGYLRQAVGANNLTRANISKLLERVEFMHMWGGIRVGFVNCQTEYASDTGDAILDDFPVDVAMLWRVEHGRVLVSLRSKKGGVNVEQIAKEYNGGGQEHAARFVMSVNRLHLLLTGQL